MRRWLPPICLVALVAVVWALPYSPNCDSLARGDDPAITRVGNECIRLSNYAERLRIIERGIEQAEAELLTDDHSLDFLRLWHDRVISFGPENVALADIIQHSALYQRAVANGHIPPDEEVVAVRDRNRVNSESFADFVELHKLAARQDYAGFKEVLERTRHPDLKDILNTTSVSDFMESFEGSELALGELEKALEEGEAYLESIGRERYWNEIYPKELRREMAVAMLEEAILDASADGYDLYAEVPRLGWLAYQQEALEEVSIELTLAAPPTVSVDRALAYLTEVRRQEQGELREEYRKLLERREERRRLTPPPPRPNTN